MDRQLLQEGVDAEDADGEEKKLDDDDDEDEVEATMTTTNDAAAPSSGGISRRDWDRVAGPLVDHFFPDGPPLLRGGLGGGSHDDDTASPSPPARSRDLAVWWPSSSSWHAAKSPPKKGTKSQHDTRNGHDAEGTTKGAARSISTIRHGKSRSRRVAVSVSDARESLHRTVELRHGLAQKKHESVPPRTNHVGDRDGNGDDDNSRPDRRTFLGSAQASAVLWTACEMLSLASRDDDDDNNNDDDDDKATALQSPLATHQNFRRLLRSIRIGDDKPVGGDDTTHRQGLHPAAVLRLASFLRPSRPSSGGGSGGGGVVGGRSTVDDVKSQSTIVQFLHLVAFRDPPGSDDDNEPLLLPLRHRLLPILMSCCVHADTHPNVRIEACRWVWHALERDREKAPTTSTAPTSLRRVAQQVRLRLQHMMPSLRENRPAKRARRDARVVAGGALPPLDRTDERAALAHVLDAMGRNDPSCQDLALILPLVEAHGSGHHRWHESSCRQWRDEFVRARQGWLPSAASAATVPSPKGKRQRCDGQGSAAASWLSRLKTKSSTVAGNGEAVSSSWQRWLGIEDDGLSPGRRSSSFLLLDMLGNRTLHHRLVLSSRRPRRRPQQEGECEELNRLDMLLPFLLSDYAASLAPSLATASLDATAGHRLSRSPRAREEGATSNDDASVMVSGMNALLAGLHALALHTNELPSAVQRFAETRLLPNWDGAGSLVPSIVSYWHPCSFDDLYRRVLQRHIEPLLVYGDAELQYRIVSSLLTPMVEHWSMTILAASQEKGGKSLASDENGWASLSSTDEIQVQALRHLIGWVDETLIKLFVRSNGDAQSPPSNEGVLELATLRFFGAVCEMQRSIPALRLNALPSPQIVYRLLLSPSSFVLDRLCHLLASYRPLCSSPGEALVADVSTTAHARQDHEPESGSGAFDLSSYASDAYLTIVPCSHGHARQNGRTMSGGLSSLFAETVVPAEALRRVDASADSQDDGKDSAPTLKWLHGAAFREIRRKYLYVQKCSISETDARTTGGKQRHGVEDPYLDYLRDRGFAGIHELCSSANREGNGKPDD